MAPRVHHRLCRLLSAGLVGALALSLCADVAFGRRRSGRRVSKIGPNVARQESLGFLRTRLVEELTPQRITAHVRHVGRRKASVAFAKSHGTPAQLDLGRLLRGTPATVQQQTATVLGRVSRGVSASWLSRLHSAQKKERDPALKSALAACAGEIEKLGSAGRPSDWETKARARFEKRFTRKLLRRASKHTSWLLPKTLPRLPASSDPMVTALIKKVASKGSGAQKLARLEREAARLTGSANTKDQRRGNALRAYLKTYKKSGRWTEQWLSKRLNTFKPTAGAIGWSLTGNVSWQGSVSAEQKREVEARLKKAWTIAKGVVHPQMLAWLPPVRVVVDAAASGAHHEGDLIKIRPDTPLKDILHELGHHVEDYGSLRTIHAAHSVLTRRAHGSAMQALGTIDPRGTYLVGESAYKGAFGHAYMGKRYSDGSTELLSTVFEAFASPKKARAFFERDGDHFLSTLQAVQRKPWPMID